MCKLKPVQSHFICAYTRLANHLLLCQFLTNRHCSHDDLLLRDRVSMLCPSYRYHCWFTLRFWRVVFIPKPVYYARFTRFTMKFTQKLVRNPGKAIAVTCDLGAHCGQDSYPPKTTEFHQYSCLELEYCGAVRIPLICRWLPHLSSFPISPATFHMTSPHSASVTGARALAGAPWEPVVVVLAVESLVWLLQVLSSTVVMCAYIYIYILYIPAT